MPKRCGCAPSRSTRWATRRRWRPIGPPPTPPASPTATTCAPRPRWRRSSSAIPRGASRPWRACGRPRSRAACARRWRTAARRRLAPSIRRSAPPSRPLARQLALESGDTTSLVVASWAQAAAAHARGDLHRSVWADLHETRQVPHLALRVFDGHLCITQRFLYGARPYADVIAFADGLVRRSAANRCRARPRLRRHAARRGRVAGRRSGRREGAPARGRAIASCHRRARRRGLVTAAAGRSGDARGSARRGPGADRRGAGRGAPDRHRLSPARPHLRHAHQPARRRPAPPHCT